VHKTDAGSQSAIADTLADGLLVSAEGESPPHDLVHRTIFQSRISARSAKDGLFDGNEPRRVEPKRRLNA
jgi:hypothetical protein